MQFSNFDQIKISIASPQVMREWSYGDTAAVAGQEVRASGTSQKNLICDDYIENLSKLIEKKEQYKKGVMQKVLSGKVRFKGFKDEWINYNFKDIFTRITGKKYQINQDKYCQVGKYPVIDQGKKYIIAYSNDENKLLKNNSIIVFGDHTRIFKYINFDFIVGADGVQLLKTNNKFNTKFMYYNLSNQYIPNTGYNRHFKFILEMRFYVPTSIEEQNKIASLASGLQQQPQLFWRCARRSQEFPITALLPTSP